MTGEYVSRLREHFVPLLQEHGATFRALDWGSETGQRRRFDALLDVAESRTASILDVGCGVGHLTDRLDERGHTGPYVGIDPLEEMIGAARKRRSDRRFEVGRLGDDDVQHAADVVVASGIFTFMDDLAMRETVYAMWDACSVAIAFNVLSTWGDRPAEGEWRRDPGATVDWCRTITRNVVFRHDYLPHDFTIYLYRGER